MMDRSTKPMVIFVPGGVTPATSGYAGLLQAMDGRYRTQTKELEVYAGDRPPSDYGLEKEVQGILRVAEDAGVERFHLVGFSAGGASSLAFTASYPQRLLSLALIEPAWIGNDGWTAEDKADFAELDRVMALPPAESMAAFRQWQLRSGVPMPAAPEPAGAQPPWMAKRPAGLQAISRAFKAYSLDRERFRHFPQPVYYAYGSLSRAFYERNAVTLGKLFPRFRAEVFEGLWHFNAPHRAEPARLARSLAALWDEALE